VSQVERFTVQPVGQDHIGSERIGEQEDSTRAVEPLHHDAPCAGGWCARRDDDVAPERREQQSAPPQVPHRPRRHAVEVGGDVGPITTGHELGHLQPQLAVDRSGDGEGACARQYRRPSQRVVGEPWEGSDLPLSWWKTPTAAPGDEVAQTLPLQEMRALVGVLRDGTNADLAPRRGLADIERLARPGGDVLGVRVQVSDDVDAVDPAVSTALYLIAVEAVTNATRHASGATQVTVDVAASRGKVRLRVHDDGAAGPAGSAPAGFGLRGMAERRPCSEAPCRRDLTATAAGASTPDVSPSAADRARDRCEQLKRPRPEPVFWTSG
jgi:hypothetical protein